MVFTVVTHFAEKFDKQKNNSPHIKITKMPYQLMQWKCDTSHHKIII